MRLGGKVGPVRANIVRLWEGLDGDHRLLARQVLRYGIAGLGVTLFQIAIYNLLSGPADLAPLVANAIGYALALIVGYIIHSRFSFEGHGTRDNVARSAGRFVAASLVGFAINSFWVWSFTARLHWKDWTPSVPMLFVTPAIGFWLNRRWVFD
jgi:putative flippase GtrA